MKSILTFSFFLLICCIHQEHLNAQDTIDINKDILKLQIQLLESKQENLHMKYQALEKLSVQLEKQHKHFDSIFNKRLNVAIEKVEQKYKLKKDDSLDLFNFSKSIHLDPYRLFEGIFQIGFEKAFSNQFSLNIGLQGTYLTTGGLGKGYLADQELGFAYSGSNDYINWHDKMVKGFGIILQGKNYLLSKSLENHKAPVGLYAGAHLMYRRLTMTGYSNIWINNQTEQISSKRNLSVYLAGIIIGRKFILFKALSLDMYVGGVMRLSKYDDEGKFTELKSWNNIDYSGVLPTMGINLGILK